MTLPFPVSASWLCAWTWALGLSLAAAGLNLRAADPEVEPAQLPRVGPKEPAQAGATFRVKPGFRFDLVAAEPLVISPVALSFDENGRLYVVEMRDYSERRPERLGRIRLLQDNDGDGRFEHSSVFAQDLPWPTAVACWDGGVFVGATPDILYLKDTTGDGIADVRETVFTGFASDYAPFETNRLNVQALLNSFNWSLENRIHGATSFSGGNVHLVDSPFVRAWLQRGGLSPEAARQALAASWSLRGRDFSFDPRTLELRPESGGGQHGMSFDNRGRKFVCSNSSHLQTLLYEDRYAARNSFFPMLAALDSVAVDGGAAPVFRISPDEPWRVIRTRWRVSGLVPGPVEGGGRPSGYFTGATGVTIYRGNAFPEDMVGDVFVADCGSNLIHHKKVQPAGLTVRGERPADETNVEFVASSDNWFRPVQFANAPDGTLYVCDMYREVIEHPWSLPPTLKKHLDLNSGNDRGRIYRLAPARFKASKAPALGRAGVAELVRTLAHPNGWHRDTAARLLCERRDRASIAPLHKLAADPKSELGRLHALYVLASLGALGEPDLSKALVDATPGVRGHAIRLAEPFLRAGPTLLAEQVARLGGDPEVTVRLQAAFSLGESPEPARSQGLFRILRYRDLDPNSRAPQWDLDQPLMRAAIMSSLAGGAMNLLTAEVAQTLFTDGGPGSAHLFFRDLAQSIGARGEREEIDHVLDFIVVLMRAAATSGRADLQINALSVTSGLGEGLRKSGRTLSAVDADGRLRGLFSFARRILTERDTAAPLRLAGVQLLAHDRHGADTVATLCALAAAEEPFAGVATPEFQKAALNSLNQLQSPEVASGLLARWARLTPSLRAAVLPMLLTRTERVRLLLKAIEAGQVNRSELNASQVELLRQQKDPALREHAERLLAASIPAGRQQAIDALRPALQLSGNIAQGQTIFTDRCAICHRLGQLGHNLGPDLATIKAAGKEKLLVNILDPNREVNPSFLSYEIETRDGENLTGIIVNESAASLTLRQAGDVETAILRTNILAMRSQGKSLMPEGLEAGLTPQGLADLMEFLLQ
ncbi:MAG TPA: PVC-type heme-binding CxxCH protein [Verrucomicrobiae bacterium]|nr:PVC-type heme-binding CxxCH protein [Verrucomicrobiae bacterium]